MPSALVTAGVLRRGRRIAKIRQPPAQPAAPAPKASRNIPWSCFAPLLILLVSSVYCSSGNAAPQNADHRGRFIGLYSCGYADDYGNLHNRFFLFAPDGRVFYGKPSWRADGTFDHDASAARDPKNAGRYQIEGDQLVLTWPALERVDKRKITRTKEGDIAFKTSCGNFKPTYPSKVTRLAGRFGTKTVDSLGGPASGAYGAISTSVSVSSFGRLEFAEDGRFTYERQGFATGTTSVGTSRGPSTVGHVSNSDGAAAQGRYRIRGNFLILTSPDGTVLQDIFEPYEQAGDPNKDGFYWGANYYKVLGPGSMGAGGAPRSGSRAGSTPPAPARSGPPPALGKFCNDVGPNTTMTIAIGSVRLTARTGQCSTPVDTTCGALPIGRVTVSLERDGVVQRSGPVELKPGLEYLFMSAVDNRNATVYRAFELEPPKERCATATPDTIR
jgi:hypothetical protein